MATPQPALRSAEPYVHVLRETCPTCEQPIPNEKAKEIRARAAALEKRLADAADARAEQQIATEKAQIEAAAKARVEQAEREKNEAVQQATAEAAAKIQAAKVEGRKLAEAGFEARIAAADKAKNYAETSAAQKVAAAEQAAKTKQKKRRSSLTRPTPRKPKPSPKSGRSRRNAMTS